MSTHCLSSCVCESPQFSLTSNPSTVPRGWTWTYDVEGTSVSQITRSWNCTWCNQARAVVQFTTSRPDSYMSAQLPLTFHSGRQNHYTSQSSHHSAAAAPSELCSLGLRRCQQKQTNWQQRDSLVYLEDVLRVVHAVHPDVVLQRGAVRVWEEHQPQALGGTHVQGLPHQGEGAQLLREHPACLGLQLAVIGLWHKLLPHEQDVLEVKRMKKNISQVCFFFKKKKGQEESLCRRKGNVFVWCLMCEAAGVFL